VLKSPLNIPPYDMAKAGIALTMGMQNGLTVAWGSSAAKTTHVTGLLTDMSVMFVAMIMTGIRKDFTKFFMFLSFYLSFITGAAISRLVHDNLGVDALHFPAGFYYTCGAFVFVREAMRIPNIPDSLSLRTSPREMKHQKMVEDFGGSLDNAGRTDEGKAPGNSPGFKRGVTAPL